jgi:nucleoside phosphorylase
MDSTPECDVLLLAAFVPELAPLRAVLGDGMRARLGALDVAARVVGIGLPMAAAGAAMQVAEVRPRVVVALGTCGVYAATAAAATSPSSVPLAIGDVAAARRVRLLDVGEVLGATQFPEPMSTAVETHRTLADALERAGAKRADVATTLAITVDDAMAARISHAPHHGVERPSDVEHLEAFGIATACAARGIPFAAAFGVANTVGSCAREEWRTHHRQATAAAAEVVLRWLRSGEPLLR